MIGILRWSIKLGRIDIITGMSFLSPFNVSPREGHLEVAYCVFEYLYSHKNGGRVVFDDDLPKVKEKQFKEVDWKHIYGDVTEDIPCNMSEPRGNTVIISMFTVAAFIGDLVTRRSQSGILIFINRTPVTWYSKRQNIVEASTFWFRIYCFESWMRNECQSQIRITDDGCTY